MSYKEDIKDEGKGHEHYEGEAKKKPTHAKAFKRMAKDEERHEGMLKKMSKMAKKLKK
jgi:rubrerythrin